MSQQLISRSPDLKKLRDEGYDLEVRGSHLLIKDVPYLNSNKEIKRGILISELTLAGNVTTTPNNHVAYFLGEYPCNVDGSQIAKMRSASQHQKLAEGVEVDHVFSAKPNPEGNYRDYYHKVETYVSIVSGPAESQDPTVTAKTFPAVETTEADSVFHYLDTASSRARIDLVTDKLKIGKVGILGLGGTGAYILDLVAKTPIREIHLFDGDIFLNHNAFRSPGAPTIDDLNKRHRKVSYFKELYSKMHRHIFAHEDYIDLANIEQLHEMNFVFIALDKGEIKKTIIQKLQEWNTPFIDVGMGINLVEGALLGILRVTTSTAGMGDFARIETRIPFSDANVNNEYISNIQIADLNALNAAIAVIKWKKLCGFYHDTEKECYSAYAISGNTIINEDKL